MTGKNEFSAPHVTTPRREAADTTAKKKEEGAVMIVTMLVVLMVTGTGAYAMLNTSYEIRGSGFVRSAAQAQYVSEAGAYGTMEWLDRVGPVNLMTVISRTSAMNGMPLDFQSFNEPRLMPGQLAHRLVKEDLNLSLTIPTITRENTGPEATIPTHPATVIVDLTDIRRVTMPVAGARSDGGVGLAQLSMAVTSRGRLRRDGDPVVDPTILQGETASDTRAYIVSVPFQP
jgi:hypothetical protein